MKKALLSLLFLLPFAGLKAQWLAINFDDTTWKSFIAIDSLNNHNNLWQVGRPQKTVFNSAYSFPNAIVTDTVNSYPVNDTSSFILLYRFLPQFPDPRGLTIYAVYRVDADTLTDYGKIELSIDHGISWIDITNDSNLWWNYGPPVLTGDSKGWKQIQGELGGLFMGSGGLNLPYGDTLLFRFSFISDSVQTNRDGLMFDNLQFSIWYEGINDLQLNNLISVYPNPANDQVIIQRKDKTNKKITVELYNVAGRLVYDNPDYRETMINTSKLINGVYMLKYSDGEHFAVKKLVVQH